MPVAVSSFKVATSELTTTWRGESGEGRGEEGEGRGESESDKGEGEYSQIRPWALKKESLYLHLPGEEGRERREYSGDTVQSSFSRGGYSDTGPGLLLFTGG